MFIWRLCSGALPTLKGLHKRIDNTSPMCSRCLCEVEYELHAVWKCSFAGSVWDASGLDILSECLEIGCTSDGSIGG